ncbi:hypothetical protein L1987_04116 [Smallanthus sonchifolius]|uniref:Uncharacterized protein n=1 Tax=Smallanthus sonchifolius TaxID=185202 RepID=A0ACB9KCK2_9ASTR|nr:hypothetical protein L1987_04116 [Smallanthus sonchifolius]
MLRSIQFLNLPLSGIKPFSRRVGNCPLHIRAPAPPVENINSGIPSSLAASSVNPISKSDTIQVTGVKESPNLAIRSRSTTLGTMASAYTKVACRAVNQGQYGNFTHAVHALLSPFCHHIPFHDTNHPLFFLLHTLIRCLTKRERERRR